MESEIEELKKQKNKDVDNIKILKVEIGKLDSLYKKFKENVNNCNGY